MSNAIAITTQLSEMEFARPMKNKTVTRGLMGLLSSGNKAERMSALDLLVHQQWNTGTFKPLVREFVRVFCTKAQLDGLAFAGVRVLTPSKIDVVTILRGVVIGCQGKTLKGEKAVYHAHAVDLLAKHDATESMKTRAVTAQTEIAA
jgi:hypothetical protein